MPVCVRHIAMALWAYARPVFSQASVRSWVSHGCPFMAQQPFLDQLLKQDIGVWTKWVG